MTTSRKFYINGEWVEPSTSATLDVINPATEEPITQIALGGREDVDRAVAAAREAFETFSQSTIEERGALLERIIDAYKARMGDLARIVSEEMGAPIGLANAAQAPAGLGHLIHSRKALREFPFEEDAGTARIVREPIGVCGLITPWNWPLNQIAAKVGPPIAAGSSYGGKRAPHSAMGRAERRSGCLARSRLRGSQSPESRRRSRNFSASAS